MSLEPGPAEYTARDVSDLAGLPVHQVRAYARAGFINPVRDAGGRLRFSFQDLVFLRTAKRLAASQVPRRRVKRALRRLLERLPGSRPLSSLQLDAQGNRMVVRDGAECWDPETGQCVFDFYHRPAEIASLSLRREVRDGPKSEDDLSADDWYELGCDLEESSPDRALGAYRRALQLDSDHLGARLNMGRLFHELGDVETAEGHYRLALSAHPSDPTATFNLAVALEDRGRLDVALNLYQRAIALDPMCADAYYNLARLYEQLGDPAAALRHLKAYRQLCRDDD